MYNALVNAQFKTLTLTINYKKERESPTKL